MDRQQHVENTKKAIDTEQSTPGGPSDSSASHPIRPACPPVASAFLRLQRAHARLGSALLTRIGVPPPQELILLRLEVHGTLPQVEIAKYLNGDRSTGNTLRSMERSGLITRCPSRKDRRALDVTITQTGLAMCPAVRDAWAALEESAIGPLSSEERVSLIQAMDRAEQVMTATLARLCRETGISHEDPGTAVDDAPTTPP